MILQLLIVWILVGSSSWAQAADTSKCSLNGKLVPCGGHAYDRRVGPAAVVPGGPVWLDASGQRYKTQIDGEWKAIPGLQKPGCYLKMREAMKAIKRERVDHGEASLDIWIVTGIYRLEQEQWDTVMKECVR